MASSAYASPTQNFGMMLALLLAAVAIDLLRNQPPKSRWVLLILIALAASGAKATVLPLAICGFGLVMLVRLFARRPARAALAAAAAMLVIFVGSVLIIYGGESSGLQIKFGSLFTQLQPYASLRHGPGVDRSALPFLAVLSCVGLTQLVHRLGDRRAALLVPIAALLGIAACGLARLLSADLPGVRGPILWMLGALLAASLLITAGWKVGRRGSLTTVFLVALVTTCTVGATTLPLEALVSKHASLLAFGKVGYGGPTKAEADAARWIRANSNSGDVVATNAHCLFQHGSLCDSRHFWIAALTERQMLVEGWAYTNKANSLSITTGINPSVLPFWNRELLATNNTAFTSPSPAAIARLRQYGVRWLYVDKRAGVPVSPKLNQYVHLRHTTTDATIYEVK